MNRKRPPDRRIGPQKRVYVSGPISGNPTAKSDFSEVCEAVKSTGHVLVNPFDLYDGDDYAVAMRADIRGLVDCDAILLIKGWERSAGARLEFLVAQMCGLKILYEPVVDIGEGGA